MVTPPPPPLLLLLLLLLLLQQQQQQQLACHLLSPYYILHINYLKLKKAKRRLTMPCLTDKVARRGRIVFWRRKKKDMMATHSIPVAQKYLSRVATSNGGREVVVEEVDEEKRRESCRGDEGGGTTR